MKIQVLGTGCAKCRMLEQNASEAVKTLGIEAEVVKIEDTDEIMDMGVMMTPALAVDGEVRTVGKVLSVDQIISIIKK